MPASRLVFALRDLVSEVRDLTTGDPEIALTLDPKSYRAVIAEIGSHVGVHGTMPDPSLSDHCARFEGVDLICGETL
jgi:hypothetical protein